VAESHRPGAPSEARFRGLVELATDFYWETDAQGAFTHVSGPARTCSASTGRPADGQPPLWSGEQRELQEKLATRQPFLDLVHPARAADGSVQVVQTSGETHLRRQRPLPPDTGASACEIVSAHRPPLRSVT
jgi:PAS domain-containing protein